MHDIRAVRADPAGFDAAMGRRGLLPQSADILAVDNLRREAIAQEEAAQARRNARAKAIGQAKGRGDHAEAERLLAE
eukprot:gene6117-7611_t